MSRAIVFRNKNNEKVYPCPYMPIGAIYKSTSNTNPTNFFGGTWTLVHSGYEREQIGSQVIYSNISGNGNVSKTNLIGAYGYNMSAVRSRPRKSLSWSYYFYVEADGDGNIDNEKRMLKALGATCDKLRVIGNMEGRID